MNKITVTKYDPSVEVDSTFSLDEYHGYASARLGRPFEITIQRGKHSQTISLSDAEVSAIFKGFQEVNDFEPTRVFEL